MCIAVVLLNTLSFASLAYARVADPMFEEADQPFLTDFIEKCPDVRVSM
jgi:hypothetical protein